MNERRVEPTPSYWPFYCEENVWHLAARVGEGRGAAFLSNRDREVALWGQRGAETPELPVVWDYHVILLAHAEGGWEVWDPESVLGLPVDAGRYLDVTFLGSAFLPAGLRPSFRLVPASLYREVLASDRRHMRRDDGSYLHPPPPWPEIGEGSNVARFADMDADFLGEVVDLAGLRRRLGLALDYGARRS